MYTYVAWVISWEMWVYNTIQGSFWCHVIDTKSAIYIISDTVNLICISFASFSFRYVV